MMKFFNNPENKVAVRQLVGWLWVALKGNRRQAIVNAMLGLLGVAVSLCSVWAMQRAIDIAAGAQQGSLHWAVALMAVLILCDFAINISKVWIKNILGVKAQNRMQQQMLDRLLRSEWQAKEKRHSGDVINRLEMDVSTVVVFLTETLPNTLSVLALFVGAFVYLARMDMVLALLTVGILPVFILLSRLYVGRMRMYSRNVRNSDSKVQSILTETVQNRMLVKTLECDDLMVGRLDATHTELRSHVRRRTIFSVISRFILNFGFSFGYLLAFLWSALRLYDGTITFGAMTAFLQLVFRIQSPARDLTKLAPAFVSVFTAAERLMELEEAPQEVQGAPCVMQAPCGIRLEDVCYAYEDDKQNNVIDHLSFEFKPGSCTAILGETGVGKTTLLRLVLALVRPDSGRVLIFNGAVCEDVSPLVRCNLVYVPQGNTLLSGTIRDNLLLGNPHATEDMMREALQKACAEFVFDLSDGLDTKTSESGGGLSEGQAQRIAIARALLRNRSIMLFDEATSALDPDTEHRLLQNVLSDNSKTVIFITHRPAVVDYCSQVLRL
ncbi:MAG: ABC transporter ATP-binding protein [Prevotella sp.]|nr:ABC transporter ATP-binding protein [Prevotella sp.]